MKNLIIVLLLLVTANLFSDDKATSIKWLTNIDSALKESKENKKPILIVFSGSDWCQNCIKLKKNVLDTKDFTKYASENLVLLLLDFPSEKEHALAPEQQKHNEKLSDKYNPEGVFPYMLFINSDEKLLGTIKGYRTGTAEEVIQKMKNILEPAK